MIISICRRYDMWVELSGQSFCLSRFILYTAVLFGTSLAGEEIYKKPQEIIDEALVTRAEANLAAGKNPSTEEIVGLTGALDAYERQFVKGRHIEDEGRAESLSYKNMNVDAFRVLSLFRDLQYGRRHFIGESPLLFRLHRALAGSYRNVNEPLRALNHYAASLRYAALPAKCRLDSTNGSDSDAILLSIAGVFADPERIAQSRDPYGKDASEFRPLFDSYRKLKLDYEEAVRRISVAGAARARGSNDPDENAARGRAEALRVELEPILKRIEEIRDGSYAEFCRERTRSIASVFAAMSDLMVVLSGDTKGEGRIILLEYAHRLDPDSMKYLDDLSGALIHTNRFEMAIDLEERWLEQANAKGGNPDAGGHLLRLASLQIRKMNWLRASEAYERYLDTEKDPEKRRDVLLNLADLHFSRTGRTDRSAALYGEYLDMVGKEAIAEDYGGFETFAVRYRLHNRLASIHRKNQRTEEEKASLRMAVAQMRSLEKIAENLRNDRDSIQKRINELHLKIKEREERNLLRDFYGLKRVELPEAEERLNRVESRIKSLDAPSMLERMALLSVRERRYEEALVHYAEIIRRGSGEQSLRARRNAQRIQQTMNDGIHRDLELPENFDR